MIKAIFFKEIESKAKLLPGAYAAVVETRKKAQILAVVSSGTKRYIKMALDKFDLTQYVDFIVAGDDVERGKPYPDLFEKAFELLPQKLNIKRDECLVVEDSINGVKAAKAANFKVLLIPSKDYKEEVEADLKIQSLKDLNKALISLQNL